MNGLDREYTMDYMNISQIFKREGKERDFALIPKKTDPDRIIFTLERF